MPQVRIRLRPSSTNASVAAFGMAGNYTAAAKGYDAVAWNPANLGFAPPMFSMSILSGGGTTGLDPVKLSDFSPFPGQSHPRRTPKKVGSTRLAPALSAVHSMAAFHSSR